MKILQGPAPGDMSPLQLLETKIFFHLIKEMYSQTCLMWPSKGTVKYGHIRQCFP